MQSVQNLKSMSLDNIVAVQSVNNGRTEGKSGAFQKFMNNTDKPAKTAEPVKAATDTKVSGDSQTVSNVVSSKENGNVSGQTGQEQAVVSDADVATVEQVVKDVVQSVLHIDDETMEAVMSEMGISLLQLLDPAVLQDFMVNMNPGADVTDFLTSETMLGNFTELMQSLEDIDWEGLTGMSKEEFVQVLESMPEQDLSEGVLELTDLSDKMAETEGPGVQTVLQEADKDVANAVLKEQKATDDADVRVQENVSVKTETVTSTETDSETEDNAAQSQLPQRNGQELLRNTRPADNQAVTVMDFVDNMVQATDQVQTGDVVKMQQMIDIVNQVVEKIHSSIHEDTTTMEMQLNPESLGKVLLSVSNRNGVMTANFTVQTVEAKEALESQMYQLRENLEQKNLKVEAVEVSVSDFTFNQSGQADTGDQKDFRQGHGKRMRFEADDGEEDEISVEAEAEQVRRSVMRDSGSSVDYIA